MQSGTAIYQAAENGEQESLALLLSANHLEVERTKYNWRAWLRSRKLCIMSQRRERFSQSFPQTSISPGLRELRNSVVSQNTTGSVPDSLLCRALCQHCGFENLYATTFSDVHHEDNYDFIRKALMAAHVVGQRSNDRCNKCHSPAKPLFVDYHTRTADDRDLVLRCFFNRPDLCDMNYGILWWQGGENYTIIDSCEISSLESAPAMVRRALRLLEDDDRAWAQAVVQKAMQVYPGYSFIELVKHFDREEESGLVEAIVARQLAFQPQDQCVGSVMTSLLTDAKCPSLVKTAGVFAQVQCS